MLKNGQDGKLTPVKKKFKWAMNSMPNQCCR